MEHQLQSNDYITGARFNIADIALFAYTHVADEGGFDLSAYAGVRRLDRTNPSATGYTPMVKK